MPTIVFAACAGMTYALGGAVDSLADLFRSATILLVGLALIQLERAIDPEDAHLVQGFAMLVMWGFIVKMAIDVSGQLSAVYLLFLAGVTGTTAFFQKTLTRNTKKLIYGMWTALAALPASTRT